MSHHAASTAYGVRFVASPYHTHPGTIAAPYQGVVAGTEEFAGLCATIAYEGELDAQMRRDPTDGFQAVEDVMRAKGLVTTMTQEQARTCYMQGYDRGRFTPQQAAAGGLILGGLGGLAVGILGTLAVQRWL